MAVVPKLPALLVSTNTPVGVVPKTQVKRDPFFGEFWKSAANDKFYAHIKSRNHQIVFASQGYKSKKSIKKLFDRLKLPLFELKDDPSVK